MASSDPHSVRVGFGHRDAPVVLALYTAGMSYYPRLINLLIAAPHRVTADGMIHLTPAEAEMLRACDFVDAAPGAWRFPPIPAHVPLPAFLARVLPQQLTRETAIVTPAPKPAAMPTSTSPSARDNASAPVCPPPHPLPARTQTAQDDSHTCNSPVLRRRVIDALRQPDHRRVLAALSRRSDGPVERRRFQRALHRLKTPAFTAALTHLIATGLVRPVTCDGVGCLLLPTDVRSLLSEAGIGVRRPRFARTMRRRERHRHQGRGALVTGRSRSRCYQRRPIPNPRKDPHGWAMSMLGRLGGLAAQRSYRMRLVMNPTATATRVREARRLRRKQAAAAASPAPVRMAVAVPLTPAQAHSMIAGRYRQPRPTTGTSSPTAMSVQVQPPPSRPTQIVGRHGETWDDATWAPPPAQAAPRERQSTAASNNDARVSPVVDFAVTPPRRRPVSDRASFGRSRR